MLINTEGIFDCSTYGNVFFLSVQMLRPEGFPRLGEESPVLTGGHKSTSELLQRENRSDGCRGKMICEFCVFETKNTNRRIYRQLQACTKDPANVETSQMPGCFSKLENYIKDNSTNILGIAVGIVIVMVRMSKTDRHFHR